MLVDHPRAASPLAQLHVCTSRRQANIVAAILRRHYNQDGKGRIQISVEHCQNGNWKVSMQREHASGAEALVNAALNALEELGLVLQQEHPWLAWMCQQIYGRDGGKWWNRLSGNWGGVEANKP